MFKTIYYGLGIALPNNTRSLSSIWQRQMSLHKSREDTKITQTPIHKGLKKPATGKGANYLRAKDNVNVLRVDCWQRRVKWIRFNGYRQMRRRAVGSFGLWYKGDCLTKFDQKPYILWWNRQSLYYMWNLTELDTLEVYLQCSFRKEYKGKINTWTIKKEQRIILVMRIYDYKWIDFLAIFF